MGSIAASTLINNVRRVTNDEDKNAQRNSDAELRAWLSEAQRALCRIMPQQHTKVGTLTLVNGARQSIPAGATMLVSVIRNDGGNAVRMTSRAVLDAYYPGWQAAPKVSAVRDYLYEPLVNKAVFYVWPPVNAGVKVEAEYATPPDEIAANEETIVVDDIYADALQNYMLFRLYSKETEDAAAPDIAAGYLKAFTAEVGG